MKRLRILLALVVTLSFSFVLEASASPVLYNGGNTFTFTGFESGFYSANGNSTFTQPWGVLPADGTIFAGVLSVSSIVSANTTWMSSSNDALYGLYLTQLVYKNGVPTLQSYDSTYSSTATAYANSSISSLISAFTPSDLASGTVLKLFTSSTQAVLSSDLAVSSTQITNLISPGSASTTSLWGSFGLVNSLDSVSLDIQHIDPLAINPITKKPYYDFGTINLNLSPVVLGTEVNGPVKPSDSVSDASLTSTVALIMNTHLVSGVKTPYGTVDGTGTYTETPGVYQLSIGSVGSIYATPEPASMLLLGTGILGLFGLRRRQKKS